MTEESFRCPRCGELAQNSEKFCTKCGKKLHSKKYYKSLRLLIKISIILLSIGICCLGIAVYFMYNNDTLKNIFPSVINCQKYQSYDTFDEELLSGYIQCTLDKKINKLNNEYKFVEQDEYWNNIYSICEHSFDNKIKYQNQNPNLIGKYNTMDKLYLATYKYSVIYYLGKIALGKEEYVGPNCMFGHGTWKKYLEVTKYENEDLKKLNLYEQIVIVQKIKKLTDYMSDKFFSTYYKNVYIVKLMGIEYNASNSYVKKLLKESIDKIYNPTTDNFFEEYTDEEETEEYSEDESSEDDIEETEKLSEEESIEREQAIEAYNNLIFDKNQLYDAYLKATLYCSEHQSDKDENGNYLNAGTGWFESCICDQLETQNEEYGKIYHTFWNYCNNTAYESEGMAGVRNCTINEFEKLE